MNYISIKYKKTKFVSGLFTSFKHVRVT